MKSLVAVLLLLLLSGPIHAADFAQARPGYRYEFPRDHFAHPDFQTEWWYYTGNLSSPDGRQFGFELTFFRQATVREASSASPWEPRDLYLAHLALSDIHNRRFRHLERLNRAGPGLAGADMASARIWNGNWRVDWRGDTQQLQAVGDDFILRLELRPLKPAVIHGRDGISRKAQGEGRASHYISFSRLAANGELELNGERFRLQGQAWMDHEFFTHQLTDQQTGWDWMSIQLSDNSELMLFRLRRKDGSIDPYSAGTYIAPDGSSRHLDLAAFHMEASGQWRSDKSGARYPLEWRIRVPSLQLDLKASTPMRNQELISPRKLSPTYWEGAMRFEGEKEGRPVQGHGYLEMTGYAEAVNR